MSKDIYDDDEVPIHQDNQNSVIGSDEVEREGVEVRIGYLHYAPTTVWLELKGSARYDLDKKLVGVDVVVILDISTTNKLDIESQKILQKRAMELFVSKLRPNDRVSVVVFSERLCPLRLVMTEVAKEYFQFLVNACIDEGVDIQRDIRASLGEALKLLQDRTYLDGRQSAILLLSGSDATDDAINVPLGDVPVHVLALGADFTCDVLKQIANKGNNGGTFSAVNIEDKESISKLRNAFSQCFSQLFTVAAHDLNLSIALPIVKYETEPITGRLRRGRQITLTNLTSNTKGEEESAKVTLRAISEIVKEGIFTQTWSSDVVGSSANVSLGDLYGQETRYLMISLNLPWWSNGEYVYNQESYGDCKEEVEIYRAMYSDQCSLSGMIHKDADAQGLKITYTYSDEAMQQCIAVVPARLETELLSGPPCITIDQNRGLDKQTQAFNEVKEKLKSIQNNAKTKSRTTQNTGNKKT